MNARYFDTAGEKDKWLAAMKADFNRRKKQVDPSSATFDAAEELAPVNQRVLKRDSSKCNQQASKRSAVSNDSDESDENDDVYRPKKRLERSTDRRAAAAAAAEAALDKQDAEPTRQGVNAATERKPYLQNKAPFKQGCNVLSAQLMWYCDSCQTCAPRTLDGVCSNPGHSNSPGSVLNASGSNMTFGRVMTNTMNSFQSPLASAGQDSRWLNTALCSQRQPFAAPLGATMNSTALSMQPSPDKEDSLLDGLVKYMISTQGGDNEGAELHDASDMRKMADIVGV